MSAPATLEERGEYISRAMLEQMRRHYARTGARSFFCHLTPDQYRDLSTRYLGYASNPDTKLCELTFDVGCVLVRGDRTTNDTDGVNVVISDARR